MTERRGRIALAAFGLASALLLGELTLGFAFPKQRPPNRVLLHRKSEIPGLAYELVPRVEAQSEGVSIRTNSLGMRDDEPASGADVYRIASVGDSFGFGWRVQAGDAYAAVLERLLNESCAGARRFDVLNLAVSGYNTRDEALVVRYKALPHRPRWIVIGYVLNDPLLDPIQPLHAHFEPASLRTRFNAVRLIGAAIRRVKVQLLGGGDEYVYLHSPRQAPWQSVVTGFAEIASDAKKVGARVCLAIFPLLDAYRTPSWDQYPDSDLHRQVATAGAEAGFRVVDFAVPFSRYPPDALRLSKTDHHPTPLAHRLAAEALKKALAPGCAPDAP